MSTSKNTSDGVISNGANSLINELNVQCGFYATELRNKRSTKKHVETTDDEEEDGVIADEGSFKMFMELLKNVEKLKELAKITVSVTTDSIIEPEAANVKSIQDFALNKKKIG